MGLIRAWVARHDGPDSLVLHAAISLNAGGAVTLACPAIWSVTDRYESFPADELPVGPVCGVCRGHWNDQRLAELPLCELAEFGYSRIGQALRSFKRALLNFNPADFAAFEQWLGPCEHGRSPITRCAICAPERKLEHGT